MTDVVQRARYYRLANAAESGADVLLEELIAEVERLRALIEDACVVFDSYDLPETAFHYRRILQQSE